MDIVQVNMWPTFGMNTPNNKGSLILKHLSSKADFWI